MTNVIKYPLKRVILPPQFIQIRNIFASYIVLFQAVCRMIAMVHIVFRNN